jgi:AcrR family transcriptional regulator
LRKRDQLIEGATVLFNSRGISAISVGEVASELQLARASVYHYVRDRADLVYQCYMRSCEQTADDLLEAATAPNGFKRLIRFISLALTPDRTPVAVLSEINSLDSSIAEVVSQAHERNLRALRRFIETGINDGSIRPCDQEVVAQAVVGTISWSQLLSQWSSKTKDADLRARTAHALIDLLSNGLAREKPTAFSFKTSADIFQPTLNDVFDRAKSSEIKVDRVLATASYLFNRNGVEATSLDEIALAMGVTKGVLYHYLEDKDDLIIRCYERAFALQEKFIEYAHDHGENGLEAALLNAHLNIQAKAGRVSPLMPQPGFGSLPEADQVRFRRIAGRQNKTIAQFLQQGVQQGVGRECEAALVTHICAGAFGWIPKWLEPEDPRTAISIADEICNFLFNGIATGAADA